MATRYTDIDLKKDLRGVRYEVREHIAYVTLDRAERGNSLAPPMQAMFRAIWSDVRDNPNVRVAILGSSGERLTALANYLHLSPEALKPGEE